MRKNTQFLVIRELKLCVPRGKLHDQLHGTAAITVS
jgi:hypothetical protein